MAKLSKIEKILLGVSICSALIVYCMPRNTNIKDTGAIAAPGLLATAGFLIRREYKDNKEIDERKYK